MARRSPTSAARLRDAERTRAAILDAALVEFGEHGYAGARTSAIARRAGVNAQLISYYFDGKEGLYRALQQRWRGESAPLRDPDLPLAEVVAGFVRSGVASRSMTRLMVWDGFTGSAMDGTELAFFAEMVADVARRQERGELAADLDPATVLLVLFSAALAPTLLPHVAAGATGLAPDSPEFLDAYTRALTRIVERLGPCPPTSS
jgi:TetR/AcrR family transcriptional regulator